MSFEFHTRRLRLRPWRADCRDRSAFERMARDPEMMRYVTEGRPWSDRRIDEFFQRQQRHLDRHGICFGAVELLVSGEVIGVCGMQPLDNGEFELGWWIWKAHWGHGYATEATAEFVRHARETMGLPRLAAVIDTPNIASKKVAQKLGLRFQCIRSARETVSLRPDTPIDYFSMELTGGDPSDQ